MAEEELQVGDFNPDTYEHVLPEGAHDFDDYDTDYEEENPELGYTDQQVQEIVEKMGKEERSLYEQCKSFLDTYYRQHGRIIEMRDLIRLIMTRRFPEIPSTTKGGAGCPQREADDRSKEEGGLSRSRTGGRTP